MLGILAILVGIMGPWVYRSREVERRLRCADNLRKLGLALSRYGQANREELPRVVFSYRLAPQSYEAFTGADSTNPFAAGSEVKPNDVTASLWLLVREGYVSTEYSPPSKVFVCPSSGDGNDPLFGRDGMPVSARDRGNFRGKANLSYSYATPFSDAPEYGLRSDWLSSGFALVADQNPGAGAIKAPVGAGPLQMKVANSLNHGGAGQNVLFGDMHAEFRESPYCGVDQDNIYTTQAPAPPADGRRPLPTGQGYVGRAFRPAWQNDSYLVPTADD